MQHTSGGGIHATSWREMYWVFVRQILQERFTSSSRLCPRIFVQIAGPKIPMPKALCVAKYSPAAKSQNARLELHFCPLESMLRPSWEREGGHFQRAESKFNNVEPRLALGWFQKIWEFESILNPMRIDRCFIVIEKYHFFFFTIQWSQFSDQK